MLRADWLKNWGQTLSQWKLQGDVPSHHAIVIEWIQLTRPFNFLWFLFQYKDIYNFPQKAFDKVVEGEEVDSESESEKEDGEMDEDSEDELEMEEESVRYFVPEIQFCYEEHLSDCPSIFLYFDCPSIHLSVC